VEQVWPGKAADSLCAVAEYPRPCVLSHITAYMGWGLDDFGSVDVVLPPLPLIVQRFTSQLGLSQLGVQVSAKVTRSVRGREDFQCKSVQR
jgi:hypothetical protein